MILLESDEPLELAAVVAYEHHIMLDGGGYPRLHYARGASTPAGWSTSATCTTRSAPAAPTATRGRPRRRSSYIQGRAGVEFDPGHGRAPSSR